MATTNQLTGASTGASGDFPSTQPGIGVTPTPQQPAPIQTQAVQQAPAQTSTGVVPSMQLQPGATGDSVKQLQDWLVGSGYMTQEQVNTGYGTYGPQTTAAVQKLQESLGIDNSSGPGYYGPKTLEALQNKYQQGFAKAQAQGGLAPADMGAAMGQVQKYVPQTPGPSIADTLMQSDPYFMQLQQMFQQYMSPQNQRQTLTQEYQSLLKSSGLEALDMQLINERRVIEGTESDIREEISGAGLATESQIAALAVARNKTLIKNFNSLVELRNSKASYLNQMMSLSMEDRKLADQNFDRAMNIGLQLMDYRDKMVRNAKESYDRIVSQAGYDGLFEMANNDPYTISLIEKTLGIAPGGLSELADMAAQRRFREDEMDALNLELKQEQIKTEKAQRSNIYSQIEERNKPTTGTPTISGKPQTATQLSANSYADRLNESNVVISNLGGKFTAKGALGGKLPNWLQSGDRQAYEQAKRNFVTAVLRRESGAAISPSEFDTAEKLYFPQAGDKSATVVQKEQSRNTAINNMYREADILRPVLPGQIIESNGKRYRVESDGETLTEL